MARDKVLSLISLATKAGRCASGEFLTESVRGVENDFVQVGEPGRG